MGKSEGCVPLTWKLVLMDKDVAYPAILVDSWRMSSMHAECQICRVLHCVGFAL